MAAEAELYYVLLSALWLCFSVLYTLRREALLALIVVLGLLAVHFAILLLRWHMVAAHCLGIVVAMVGLSFAAVPLYRAFCQATGAPIPALYVSVI